MVTHILQLSLYGGYQAFTRDGEASINSHHDYGVAVTLASAALALWQRLRKLSLHIFWQDRAGAGILDWSPRNM